MEYEIIHTFDYIISDFFLPATLTTLGTALVIMFLSWGSVKLVNFFRALMR